MTEQTEIISDFISIHREHQCLKYERSYFVISAISDAVNNKEFPLIKEKTILFFCIKVTVSLSVYVVSG